MENLDKENYEALKNLINSGDINSAIRSPWSYNHSYDNFHAILKDCAIDKYTVNELPAIHSWDVATFDSFKSDLLRDGFDVLRQDDVILIGETSSKLEFLYNHNGTKIGVNPKLLVDIAVDAMNMPITDVLNAYSSLKDSALIRSCSNDIGSSRNVNVAFHNACIDKAFEINNAEIINNCLAKIENLDHLLFDATTKNDVNRMRLLLDAGANPNTTSSRGISVLHKSINEQNVDAIKLLVGKKASVPANSLFILTGIRNSSYNYDTSLEIVKTLVKSGADVNAVDDSNKYALQKFAINEDDAVVIYLISDSNIIVDCVNQSIDALKNHFIKTKGEYDAEALKYNSPHHYKIIKALEAKAEESRLNDLIEDGLEAPAFDLFS